MKRCYAAILCAFLNVILCNGGEVEVYFSPEGPCQKQVCSEIRSAIRSIDVMMYYFTNPSICEALADAQKKKVDIRIILDSSQKDLRYSSWKHLRSLDIPIHFYNGEGLLHHKVAIIDGETVLTGSYNWTQAAQKRNQENLIIIKDEEIAGVFQKEFEKLFNKTAAFEENSSPSDIKKRAPPAAAVDVFISSRNSNVFHRNTCPFIRRIKKENLIIFRSLRDALRSGRRPCRKCAE